MLQMKLWPIHIPERFGMEVQNPAERRAGPRALVQGLFQGSSDFLLPSWKNLHGAPVERRVWGRPAG